MTGKMRRFNDALPVLTTNFIGSIWWASAFAFLAPWGMPAGLRTLGFQNWFAEEFLQLVLLSVIMVGQTVQSLAADARATNTFKDAETILDRLDLHTQGGLKAIMDRLDEVAPPVTTPNRPSPGTPSGEGG